MSEREELEALRRLAELEAKAGGADFSNVPSNSAKPTTMPGKKRAATYNLTGIPGVSTQLGGVLDAAQHHAMNIPHGIAQLLEHGVNSAANALLPAPQQTVGGLVSGQRPQATGLARVRQYINDTVASDDAALRQREADYQARTDGNAGSYVGAAIGEVAPWMFGIGEARALGLLPKVEKGQGFLGKAAELAKKTGLLAAEGGTMGLVQPVTGEGSYGSQKVNQIGVGAGSAPLLAGAGGAAGATLGLRRYLTAGGRETIAGQRLAKELEKAGITPDMLDNPSAIPGYKRSIAQAAPNARTVALERGLRNDRGGAAEAFANQDSANNAALRDQVAQVAGTEAEMTAAKQALRDGPGRFWKDNLTAGDAEGRFNRAGQHLRQAMDAKPMPMPERNILDQARKIVEQVHRGTKDALAGENEIAQLAPKSAHAKRALAQAQGILNQGMVNPSRIIASLQNLALSGNPTVSAAAEKQLAVIAKNQVDSSGWVHAGVLDDLRQNIGNTIANPLTGKVDAVAAAKFQPFKSQVVSTIERAVPGYRDSLATYRAGKQPINDMEAGRSLLDAINSRGRDVGSNQTVNLNDVRSLLGRDMRRKYPMSPTARDKLAAVMDELQQRTISGNKVAASGPGTAADMGDTLKGGMFRLLGTGGATTLGGLLGHVPGAILAGTGAEGARLLNRDVTARMGLLAADAPAAAARFRALQAQQPLGLLGPISPYLLPYAP